MGGGASGSDSKSKPLTAAQRTELFKGGLANIASASDAVVSNGKGGYTLNVPSYEAPNYVSAGDAKTLTDGDYAALQDSLLKGTTAGLDYAKAKDVTNSDANAAKRGIWSSGLAMQAQNDINNAYSSAYEKAGADATSQRYSLQANELNNLNNYNQTSAAAENANAMENANRAYNSAWQPANYLRDLYNQTGGTISSGSSSGFNFNI